MRQPDTQLPAGIRDGPVPALLQQQHLDKPHQRKRPVQEGDRVRIPVAARHTLQELEAFFGLLLGMGYIRLLRISHDWSKMAVGKILCNR
jgi:hypothetical protein